MIVRSIKVGGWRCFLEEVAVGPLQEGMNVICAPNGWGKSTILEALRRALLDGHKVTGEAIDAIRPWGRQLTPKVTVEFAHQGNEYRISKQYLDHPTSLLERKEGGRYRNLAEANAADTQTREILSQNPPGRGLSKEEHSGLAQVLWASQGNLAFETLSGDVVTDIRDMLGAQVSADGAGAIEKRIGEKYLQYFTTRGARKGGKDAPRVWRLEKEIADAEAVLREGREHYRLFDDASRRVEDSRSRRQEAKRYLEQIQQTLHTARREAEAYRKLVSERDKRTSAVDAARARHGELKNRIQQIQDTQTALESSRESSEVLEGRLPLIAKDLEQRDTELTRWKTELENTRKAQPAVDAAAKLAQAARLFVDGKEEWQRLDDRIVRIRGTQKRLDEQQEVHSKHIAPDDKTLRAIRKAITDRDAAQVRLDAALITLEIVSAGNASAEVLSGEETGPVELKGGIPFRIQGSPEIVADLPGIARIRAFGPAGSTEEHREERNTAAERLRGLTAPFGTTEIERLEAMHNQAKDLAGAVKTTKATLDTLLSEESLDELIRRHAALKITIDQTIKEHPEWEGTLPDAQALEAEASKVRTAHQEKMTQCEESKDRAQEAWTTAKERMTKADTELSSKRNHVNGLADRVAALVRENKPITELQKDAETVLMEWDATKAKLTEIEEDLRKYTEDPGTTVEQLESHVERAGEEAQKARDAEVQAERDLQQLSAEGPYSAMNRAEEEVEQLKADLTRERLRVDAIKLLHDTLAACRSEAIAAVARPVENTASQMLQRIAGLKLGRIQINESFAPVTVIPDGHDGAVKLEYLSGGEREQLYLATRLALAEAIGEKERQLVVIDDVLTATDAGRLARIKTILEEAAERFQILILTCHKERYLGLKDSNFIDLEEILRARVAAG